MVVIADIRDQVVARFFRGSFSTKKLRAHVVVDPEDARAVPRETPYTFRANQSRSTCNNDRARHSGFAKGVSFAKHPYYFACGRVHSRGGKLRVALQHALD